MIGPRAALAVAVAVGYVLMQSVRRTESMAHTRPIKTPVALPATAAAAAAAGGMPPSTDRHGGPGLGAKPGTRHVATVPAMTSIGPRVDTGLADGLSTPGRGGTRGEQRPPTAMLETEPLAAIAVAQKLVDPDDTCHGAAFVVGVGRLSLDSRKPKTQPSNEGEPYCTCAKPYVCKGAPPRRGRCF